MCRQYSSGAVPSAASNRLNTIAGPACAAVCCPTSAITLPPSIRVRITPARWSLPGPASPMSPGPLSLSIARFLDIRPSRFDSRLAACGEGRYQNPWRARRIVIAGTSAHRSTVLQRQESRR
ncbi:hypothetical protein G6F59_015894 [Rhizopus arrhizus]|nr:hypothetical protein G6F59_015894 [Rhizopus arrhizus]